MFVSALFGSRLVVPFALSGGSVDPQFRNPLFGGGSVIESSSRPQKKATQHHMKSRPRKTQPWDIRRGPTVYPPLPPLPPDWTFVSNDTLEANSPPSLLVEAPPE